jgi:hypothetical protein
VILFGKGLYLNSILKRTWGNVSLVSNERPILVRGLVASDGATSLFALKRAFTGAYQ